MSENVLDDVNTDNTEPNRYANKFYDTNFGRGILIGLQRKPVLYFGTVPEGVKQERRAKNRVARKQRVFNERRRRG